MSELTFRSKTIQRVRQLISDKRARDVEHAFVIEGEAAVRDAIRFGAKFDSFVVVDDKQSVASETAVPVHVVNNATMGRLSDTETPSGVLAVVARNDSTIEEISTCESIVVCDGVSDPGNAGTIIRSASAAGFDAVVFTERSVDPYNPKVVRSSAAAILSLPIVIGATWNDLQPWTTMGLDANSNASIWDFDIPQKLALVVGNEAHGLSNACDITIAIPIANEIESLNAAMATTIACFEIARRRAELR